MRRLDRVLGTKSSIVAVSALVFLILVCGAMIVAGLAARLDQ